MVPYVGNSPYCYANAIAMLLAGIGEQVSPSLIEVLTGVGQGTFWSPGASSIWFSSTPPDVGVSRALDILGFEYLEKAWTEAEAAPWSELRVDMRPAAVLGPVDMGYLDYLPYHQEVVGADHYVLAYAIDEEQVHLHDPDGFPHVSLSLEQLARAWQAERIDYRRGSFRYWTAPQRVRQPTGPEIYDRALEGFRAGYRRIEELAGRLGWVSGPEAILACAGHVRGGVPPAMAGEWTGFTFRLGARRALDCAAFMEGHDARLAALKENQAGLFGRCHMHTIRAEWTALAETLETLADVEGVYRAALLA